MSYKDFHGDSEIAMKYGAEAACIYNHICFWIDHNKLKNKNLREGSYWVFHSYTDFQNRYPFLTYNMIRLAIKKLTEGCISHITKKFVPPILKKGNFNQMKADKTTWYALIDDSKVGLTYEKTEEDKLEDAQNYEQIVKEDISVSLEAQSMCEKTHMGFEQDLRGGVKKHSGVLGVQKNFTMCKTTEQYSNEPKINKTASTCVREAGAASLQKIGFDYDIGEFTNSEAVKDEFEGKYKERLMDRGIIMSDLYFEACDLIKNGLKVEKFGSFLESFFRDRAYPWIRNAIKKKHEQTLTAEQIKQGRANYEFYCSLPFNRLLEFRDLHIKVKNRDYECYVYANTEEFKKFIDRAYGELYV